MTLAESENSVVKAESPAHRFVLNSDGLDLESTLDGGQAFRWWRVSGESQPVAYDGVIGSTAVRISALRQAQDGGDTTHPLTPSLGGREKLGALRQAQDGALRQAQDGALRQAQDGTLRQAQDGALGDITVEVRSESVPVDFHETVADYLGIPSDLSELRAHFATDPCIGPAIVGFPGLRLLRQDPWECLVSFICSSTSNIPRIKLNVNSIARELGQPVGAGKADFKFPAPDVVAGAGEQFLRDLGLGFRAKYVIPAAEAVASGELDLPGLREVPFYEARAALVNLTGVGEKIADCVMAFSLDKPEAFPVDRHIRRALERWYGLPGGANNSNAADFARKRFGRFGAVAQQYMFHRERLAQRANWGGDHVAHALPEDR